MNVNILPLGTAVNIKSARAVIAGYRLTEIENHFNLYYVLLPLRCELDKQIAFGVFDGMGGEADGETASFLCASTLKDFCERSDVAALPPKNFLCQAFEHMNEAVCRYAAEKYIFTGSTAAILCLADERAYVCNVGDSTIFRLRDDELFKVTKDHADTKPLSQNGIVRPKPRLTQYIGMTTDEAPLKPYIARAPLKSGDLFLLCSDGLTDMLSYADIFAWLRSDEDLQLCVENVISAALKNGGRDNITVILVRVDE